MKCNSPQRAKSGKKQKKTVKACQNGKEKIIQYGYRGMQDFTQHKDEKRKKNYLSRHGKEDHTISNALSPAFLARHVLWSEKTVPEAVRKLNRKYNNVQFSLK